MAAIHFHARSVAVIDPTATLHAAAAMPMETPPVDKKLHKDI
jgi:hypothetical protein